MYLKYDKGHAKTTITRVRAVNRRFFRKAGITTFHDITKEVTLDFFRRGRRELEWKPNTFATYLSSLEVFMKWLVKYGYLTQTFLETIEKPKQGKRHPKRLHKDEAIRWLRYVKNFPYQHGGEFASKRNHAIYATFLYTGIRRMELANLEMRDFNLQAMELKVRSGKGDKDRVIPLCYTYIEILQEYLDIRKKYRKTCAEVFTSIKSNKGLTIPSLINIQQRLNKTAPVPCTFHQLRSTFATLMAEGNCEPRALQAMMGHASLETTMGYVDVTTTHLKAQIVRHPLNRA